VYSGEGSPTLGSGGSGAGGRSGSLLFQQSGGPEPPIIALLVSPRLRRVGAKRRTQVSTEKRMTFPEKRRGAESNRCTGLCRPLPNLSATAPARVPWYPPDYSRAENLRGEARPAQNARSSGGVDLVPGLMARHLDWSPGPLPGLRFAHVLAAGPAGQSPALPRLATLQYASFQLAVSAGPGASRRRSRRRAKRERRSARRLSAIAEASSPLRARRSKSL
jgi:hypothetical protein